MDAPHESPPPAPRGLLGRLAAGLRRRFDPHAFRRFFDPYSRARWELSRMAIRLPQEDFEFRWFCRNVKELRASRYLEIGSRDGASLYVVAAHLPKGSLIVSVDLPAARWGGPNGPENLRRIGERLARRGFRFHAIAADSHDPATLERVRQAAVEEPFDALFLDGDHTYEGVSMDWRMYRPLVRDGGLVGFHDLILSPRFPDVQVGRLFEELKKTHRTEQRFRQYGLGLVRL
ncbi:MAG: class I SAM-dependent methyltransferase [Planctomycetota bacterium]|nr:class I SAM-dependent methyltransferase [Planctomycetota bacterium]